ncbi:unnamed protein product [Prorocentrum cordatum]|uniref:DRBM domain-containing protein n=1 Tax=Prorocentrum cordatum TaxID=2364126 RepID=A0ABN9SNH6_9DINO|nr:unnamed protein product [Polarella glacialis]
MDPVSALNLAVMGHFKPHGNQGEEMPLSFQDADLGGGAGFAIEVTVCDLKVVGPRCDSKKIAKREAAHLAVRRLVEMAAGDA